jgi:hypothetical protein
MRARYSVCTVSQIPKSAHLATAGLPQRPYVAVTGYELDSSFPLVILPIGYEQTNCDCECN